MSTAEHSTDDPGIRLRAVAAGRNLLAYLKHEQAQSLGVISGALGAWMLSQNADYSKWGWIGFLVSNLFLLTMAWRKKLWGLALMQSYFSFTSINGIIRWF